MKVTAPEVAMCDALSAWAQVPQSRNTGTAIDAEVRYPLPEFAVQ